MAFQTAQRLANAVVEENDYPGIVASAEEIDVTRLLGTNGVLMISAHATQFTTVVAGVRHLRNRYAREDAKARLIGTGNPDIVTSSNSKAAIDFDGHYFAPASSADLALPVGTTAWGVAYAGYPLDTGSNQIIGPVIGAGTTSADISPCVGMSGGTAQRPRFFANDNSTYGSTSGTENNAGIFCKFIWGADTTNGLQAENNSVTAWADGTYLTPLTDMRFRVGGGLNSAFAHTGEVQKLAVFAMNPFAPANTSLLAALRAWLAS
ncbi:hypothetical protein L2U69_11770 [Zavarzinia compransoris]|uniref:hypothetical protein n=1 Tax=Zavarzinia marina TaxID=2911065 RepID=UPI001F343BFE|nr:hypothetical protein [Zavarzinia marina]MCF4166324.1 hypothetical protein [Zavarzinia marina]